MGQCDRVRRWWAGGSVQWGSAGVLTVALSLSLLAGVSRAAEDKHHRTHSRAQYVHRIHLLDSTGQQIDPRATNAPPYSPKMTCGKCHAYESISHGYHFNALMHPSKDDDKTPKSDRPGEPWILVDHGTGTVLPLSYRGWPGTHQPASIGLTPFDFITRFPSHQPGGGPGDPDQWAVKPEAKTDAKPADGDDAAASNQTKDDADAGPKPHPQWQVSGAVEIDCLSCHSADRSYSNEAWLDQVKLLNFAYAPTAAAGLAVIDGKVDSVKSDADDEAVKAAQETKPKVAYNLHRFDGEDKVFFDVVRKPSDNACYACHTARPVGKGVESDWNHDDDVHIKAGMACVDCHRNGIAHHTVRGFEGEQHPTGMKVETLSCRGCHMDDRRDRSMTLGFGGSGRLGAPKPLHKGLPPLHIEKMSCTACHSGPIPTDTVQRFQTSLAHGLDKPDHYEADAAPGIVAPVFIKREVTGNDGQKHDVIYPHRMTWPAFWGVMHGEEVHIIPPDEIEGLKDKLRDAYRTLDKETQKEKYDAMRQAYADYRNLFRVRGSFTKGFAENLKLEDEEFEKLLGKERAKVDSEKWTEEERIKVSRYGIGKVLSILADVLHLIDEQYVPSKNATPVYVSGGKLYRLDNEGKVETIEHESAEGYSWPLGHDVRPARWSLGVKGCAECHSDNAPMFEGQVVAVGLLPDDTPPAVAQRELQGFEPDVLKAWNESFKGRPVFKWIGFVSIGVVVLLLLLALLLGLNGALRMCGQKGDATKT